MKYLKFCLFIIVFGFSACEEETIDTMPDVVTEDLLYISGDRLVISGRVLSTSKVQIEDHGFWISGQEDFSNPITISLGERSVPGRFIGESEALEIAATYFGKSYMIINGSTIFGNVVTFNTLRPELIRFSPKIGNPGQPLIIEGNNFTTETSVLIDNQKVEIDELIAESVIKVKIPPSQVDFKVDVSVKVQDELFTFDEQFEYVTGKFIPIGPSLSNATYLDNVFFKDDTYLYFGLGVTTAQDALYAQFNKIDVSTGTWESIEYNETPLAGSFFTEKYFGSGSIERVRNEFPTLNLSDQFMSFEAGQVNVLPSLPFRLYQAVAFEYQDQLIVYGGETTSRAMNRTVFTYDIGNQTWDQKATEAPIDILNARPSFQTNGAHFFMDQEGFVWAYDVSTDIWEKRSAYPERVERRILSIEMNGKVFFGVSESNRKMWEYEISTDSWKRKNSFPFTSQALNFASWELNDQIYLFMKLLPEIDNKSIWLFEPEAL